MAHAPRSISILSTIAVDILVKQVVLPQAKEAGIEANIAWDPTTVLMRRVEGGERADAIIATDEAIESLTACGIVSAASTVAVAKAFIGIAVRQGEPRPDISTVTALKDALLAARSVAYSRTGASGIYFAGLIQRLGIADAVNARATIIPSGFTAEMLATGDADLAIQQVSELMTVAAAEIVGPLPDEVQTYANFSAAVFSDTPNQEAAADFLALFRRADIRQVMPEYGLRDRA
jgi:molybdate transport system substrate-binding protein